MGRFQGLLNAAGGCRSRHSRLGKWFEVMSRVRDGDTDARGARAVSLARSLGGQISLSSPQGQAILRMSSSGSTRVGGVIVNPEKSAVDGNRQPIATWFNDGHQPRQAPVFG